MLNTKLQRKLFQKLIHDISHGIESGEIFEETETIRTDGIKGINPYYTGTIRTALGNIDDSDFGIKTPRESVREILVKLKVELEKLNTISTTSVREEETVNA